jgi:uncharacterized secreted protein with C-terminal beta-propeller domain
MDQHRNRPENLQGGLRPLMIGGLALIGWLGAAAESEAAAGYRLNQASSCDAVRDQLVDPIVEQLMNRSYPHGHRWRERDDIDGLVRSMPRKSAAAPSASAEASGRAGGSGAGPSHYTTTNNQVVGVDEADQVKTDGRYIYTIYGSEVLIIKSWPARSTGIVARYKLTSGSPTQLFVNGDKLVVFSSAYAQLSASGGPGQARQLYRPSFSAARVTILDVRDRTDPRLIAHVDFEGALLRARMIGSDIYLVSNNTLQLPATFWNEVNRQPVQPRPDEGRPYRSYRYYPGYVYAPKSSRDQIRARVRRALAQVSVEQLLPSVAFSYGTGQQPSQRPLLDCSDLYFPAGQNNTTGLVTLSHLSLNGGRVQSSAVVGNGMQIYASDNAMYVAAANYRSDSGEYGTQIHKFDLQRWQGSPRYAASGVVPGNLLNQFSMDEHRGYLRVATTDNGWRGTWSWRGRQVSGPASNVLVLQQRQGELATVGQVRGLAPGERIFAARMIGDQGYVVTFRQTDPLFTLDLSRPSQPRVMGELKIPGFSSYLHPIGSGQLLTVGQDADEGGRVQGAHLQIFDVTDLKNPRRTHHYKLTVGASSSSSLAQWDHLAFTFDGRTRTLALPLTVNNYYKEGGNFAGVILVKVDAEKGFSNLGDVEHSDLALRAACATSSPCTATRSQYWQAPVQRSIFMDDVLYTLSSYGLKVNQLPGMSTVAALTFAPTAEQAFLR